MTSNVPDDYVALVPARGGSKGIPGKNLYPVNGVPLLAHTLDAVLGCAAISDVFVSSDSDEILSYSDQYADTVKAIKRPAELARDLSTTDAVIEEFIARGTDEGYVTATTRIVLVQPTSPLRTHEHVSAAIARYESLPEAKLLLSVVHPRFTTYKAFVEQEDGSLSAVFEPDSPFLPRQLFPKTCYPNGAIYIFTAAAFSEGNCMPRSGIYPLEMSWQDSIDIDDLSDVKLAEYFLQQRQQTV